MKRYFEIAAAVIFCGALVSTAEAHEFWIDGTIVEADGGIELELDLKVGQMLEGVSLPYIPDTIESFEWVQGGTGIINGTIGDIPATRVSLPPKESVIIFHRTRPRRLVHQDWEEFKESLRAEGLSETASIHLQRGLPLTGFTETYTRHAKLVLLREDLVDIEDQYLGSPLEFVLERVERKGDQVNVSGRLEGPIETRQRRISVIQMTSAGSKSQAKMSDHDGAFELTIVGDGPILLNAVSLTSVSGVADWHSDWASALLRILPETVRK